MGPAWKRLIFVVRVTEKAGWHLHPKGADQSGSAPFYMSGCGCGVLEAVHHEELRSPRGIPAPVLHGDALSHVRSN